MDFKTVLKNRLAYLQKLPESPEIKARIKENIYLISTFENKEDKILSKILKFCRQITDLHYIDKRLKGKAHEIINYYENNKKNIE